MDSCAIHLEALFCDLLNISRDKARDKAGEQPIVKSLVYCCSGDGSSTSGNCRDQIVDIFQAPSNALFASNSILQNSATPG
jgi:hypothetical protein